MIVLQAIVTKYFGPTNTRGSRIKATASAGSIFVPYDCALNTDDNHMVAAETLATKLGWEGRWYAGGMPEGNGNVFVCPGRDTRGDVYAAFVVRKPAEETPDYLRPLLDDKDQ